MTRFRRPRFIKKHILKTILRRFGCKILTGRGKGSHWVAVRVVRGVAHKYTFANHREYGHDYINPARRALKLTVADGVSDEQFYTGCR